MADKEAAVADAPATGEGVAPQPGVDETGNMTGEALAGIFLSEMTREETEVSEEGEGESAEQATNDESETEADSSEETHAQESDDETDDQSDESEDDDVLNQLHPNAAKKARKRIDKLTREAREAQERAAALEERLQRLEQTQQPEEPKGNSFADRVEQAGTVEQLNKLYQSARETKQWARRVLAEDKFDYDGNIEVGDQKYSKVQIANALNEAEEAIETVLPQRFQHLQMRQQADQNAMNDFPAWKDPSHPDREMLEGVWRNAQHLHNVPNGRYLAGLIVEGIKARQAAAKPAEEKPKPESKPREQKIAPKVPGGETGYSPPPANEASDMNKRMNEKDSLSQDDFVALLAAKERERANKKG